MQRSATALFLAAALLSSNLAIAADNPPAYIGKHVTSQADTNAINKVIEDFQTAIKKRDPKLLSTLVLNSHILFDAPWAPDDVLKVRETRDVTFNGIRAGGYNDFARFIGTTKENVEEKFYNIKITQDGHLAWVMFDYEFVVEGKTQNYGVETWQMMKVPNNEWKIFSVVWSMHPGPGIKP